MSTESLFEYVEAVHKLGKAQGDLIKIHDQEIEMLRSEIKFLRGIVGGIAVLVITLFALYITS